MTMTDELPGTDMVVQGTATAALMALSPEEAKEAMERYQAISRALITPDDMQAIRGKDFPKRSALTKLANAYNVSTEIRSREVVYGDDGIIVRASYVVRATRPDGRYMEGDGTCSVNEDRFRRGDAKIDHNLPATAKTRATNRAISDLVAFGAVSAEEADAGAASPGGGATGTQPPAWAAPVADVPGVAQTLVKLLAAAGVPEPAERVVLIGQAIFDECDESMPTCVAHAIAAISAAITTAAEAPAAAADAQDGADTPEPTPAGDEPAEGTQA